MATSIEQLRRRILIVGGPHQGRRVTLSNEQTDAITIEDVQKADYQPVKAGGQVAKTAVGTELWEPRE